METQDWKTGAPQPQVSYEPNFRSSHGNFVGFSARLDAAPCHRRRNVAGVRPSALGCL